MYFDYDFNGRKIPVFGPDKMVGMKPKAPKPTVKYQEYEPVIVHAFDEESDKPYYAETYIGPVADTSRTTFDSFEWGDASLDQNLRGSSKIATVEEALHTLSTLTIEDNPVVAEVLIKSILQAEPKRALTDDMKTYIKRLSIGFSIPSTDWITEEEFKANQGAYVAYIVKRHDGVLKYKKEVFDVSSLLNKWDDSITLNPRTGFLDFTKNVIRNRVVKQEDVKEVAKEDEKEEKEREVKEDAGPPQAHESKGRISKADFTETNRKTILERIAAQLKYLKIDKIQSLKKGGTNYIEYIKLGPTKGYEKVKNSLQKGDRFFDWDYMVIGTEEQILEHINRQ